MDRTTVGSLLYGLAAAAYVFVASGYISRFIETSDPSKLSSPLSFAYTLTAFDIPLILAPLCVLAALKHRSHWVLLLDYVILVYIAMWGGAVFSHEQFAFDPPPGLRISWEENLTNSLVLLVIQALLYIAPTGLIWALARFCALKLQRR